MKKSVMVSTMCLLISAFSSVSAAPDICLDVVLPKIVSNVWIIKKYEGCLVGSVTTAYAFGHLNYVRNMDLFHTKCYDMVYKEFLVMKSVGVLTDSDFEKVKSDFDDSYKTLANWLTQQPVRSIPR